MDFNIDQIQIGQIQIGQIQIGDYADITFANGITSRYYVTKIESNTVITIKRSDPYQIKHLIKVNDLWISETSETSETSGPNGTSEISKTNEISDNDGDYNIPYTVTFTKYMTDIKYLERDFTQPPTKIINIDENKASYRDTNVNFIELKNGIIFHQLRQQSRRFGFIDPNTNKTFSKVALFDDMSWSQIMTINNEIFIYRIGIGDIVKLNLNDCTITEYDRNHQYMIVYPLKNNKIFCMLEDESMYILDVITHAKINVKSTSLTTGYIDHPIIHQLSDGNVIIELLFRKRAELYHVNINDGVSQKIALENVQFYIIAILPDNEVLLFNFNWGEIQIWSYNNYTMIMSRTICAIHYEEWPQYTKTSKLLQNGDVLFNMDKTFYLFNFTSEKIVKIPLEYPYHVDCVYQELRNGNILINNGASLSILEFPLSQREIDKIAYDNVSPSIALIPEMLALIRTYL